MNFDISYNLTHTQYNKTVFCISDTMGHRLILMRKPTIKFKYNFLFFIGSILFIN